MSKAPSLGDTFREQAKRARHTEEYAAAADTLKAWVGTDKSFETSGKIGTIASMFGVDPRGKDGSDLRDVDELIDRLEKKNPGAAQAVKLAYRH
jgi:hypothetical protein